MKKSAIIIGAVLALSLTACQKELRELQDTEPYNYALTATRESDPETRATLTGNTTLTWLADETIGMYTNANKFEKMKTKEGGTTATFTGMMQGTATTCAVYPYSIAKSLSSDKVTAELPDTREWEANKVDPPMLATFSTTNPSSLTFKHLGGLVKITLKGVPTKYTSFSFIADKAIVGSFEAAVSDGSQISSTAASTTNNTLKFTFSNSNATDMDFYIPVPVGTYNFSIKLAAGDSDYIEKSGKVSVERGKYHSLAALTISETSGSGESTVTKAYVASSESGTVTLPAVGGTVNVTMEGNENDLTLTYAESSTVYPETVNILCKGNITKTLTINLAQSHVEIKKADGVTANKITINALSSSTSSTTLVLGSTVGINEKLTVAAGSVEIAGTAKEVEVQSSVGEEATVKVAEGASITGKLTVAQAKSVEIAGTVPTVTVASTATAPVVTVASTANISTKLEVAKGSVEVANGSTIDAVEVAATVSNVTIATAVKTVTVTAAETTTETAPVIWVTETGKVTEAVEDKTATSGTSSVTVVAANGQTTNTEVGDGQAKLVKNSSGNAITNAVKTPADYLKEKIENGGEITLEDNISGNFTVADGKTVVINLNGKTVSNGEGSDAATFTVALGGKLTINGEGTVDNKINRCAAIHNNGTLVLNGGTYTRSAEGSGNSYYTILNHGDMTINSGVTVENTGTFSSTVASGYDTWMADVSATPNKYSYTEGTNHQYPSLTINAGATITGGKYNVKNGTDGKLTVASGVELSKVKDNNTVSAYVASEEALHTAVKNESVSKVIFNADITGDFTVASGRAVVINLNGKKVTNSTGDTFTVALGGSLTIEGEGTVDNVTHGKACIYNNGTVALNGGTYTRSKENGSSKTESGDNSYYNILNHGTMTIAEGVTVSQSGGFSSMIANGYYSYNKSTDPRSGYVSGTNAEKPSLTISGGSFEGGLNTIKNDDGANLEINGGAFVNTKQACIQNNNYATINGGTFSPTGAVAVQSRYFDGGVNAGVTYINGGTFNGSLVSYGGGAFVFGDNFTNSTVYVADEKSLNATLVNARVSTIALNGDITLSDKLIIGIDRTLVIDLNGKTLTGRTNLTKGNVTFKNGIIAGGKEQALNVYGSKDSSAREYSVLTVEKNVTVTADEFAVCIFGNAATANGYGAVANINGTVSTTGTGKEGSIFVSGNIGQKLDGDNFSVSTTNIVNISGSITSEKDAAVAINGAATVNVNKGAVVTGNTAITVKRGKLVVNGGTITGNGTCYSSPEANYNGTEMTGSAVSATDTYSQYGPLSVEIKGGTFTSAAYTILNNTIYDFNISGGTFSSTLKDTAIAVWARLGNINITGGTFETSSNEEATLYVGTKKSILNGKQPKLTVSGESTVVKNNATGVYKWNSNLAPLTVNAYNELNDYKSVEISGGTFHGNNPSKDDAITTDYGNFLAEGYTATETSSGSNVWKVAANAE